MLLVNSPETLSQALEFINGQEYLSYDIETNGLNTRKHTIIGFGVAGALDGFYVPLYVYSAIGDTLLPTDFGHDAYRPILEALQRKKLIMHNASFDIRFTKNNLGVDLLQALHCDTMLLKHTCDEEFPFGLKEIATKLWGTDVTQEKQKMLSSIKQNYGTTTQYFKADMLLLAEYCTKDALLTMRLYSYYSKLLEREGLSSFFYEDEVMPLLREVVIPMEQTGVALDVPKLTQALKNIDSDLKSLESTIQNQISPHLLLFRTWFLDKDYPLLTYTGKPSSWTKKHTSQFEAWRADNPDQYMFNLLSKHHLKKLFFNTLQETPLSKTPTGMPQVDDEFLSSISDKYNWVKLLIDYNKLTKLRGTYILKFIEGAENGRYYPSFMLHRTVSGRLAGDLQQLPRRIQSGDASPMVVKYTNLIREFITADAEYKLVSADYEQLEPTIFAHTSGDQALQAIFNSGDDFYSEVAIQTEQLAGFSSKKSDVNYLGSLAKSVRQRAKAYALGIAYGMTGYKLKFEIGCSQEEADTLVEDYLNAFPELKNWMAASQEQAKHQGQVKTQSGRVRHLPNAKRLWQQYGSAIGDDLQLWKQFNQDQAAYQKAKADRKIFKNELNNAINFQVQGLAASIINRASIRIARRLKALDSNTYLVCQIHDELVYEVPEAQLSIIVPVIKHEMENIVKLTVPLKTVPQVGNNYAQCK